MTRALTFIDFERAVITAVLCWPEQALPLVPGVEVDDFGVVFHRHAWTAIRNLEAARKPVEILAVADEVFAGHQLANDGKCTVFDECAVVVKLATLALESPHNGDADEHTRNLRGYARALRTIRYAREERCAG